MSQPNEITPEVKPKLRRRKRRHVHSFLWWVGHVAMAVPVLLILVLGVGYWRLTEGPVSIPPLAVLLENRANSLSGGENISIGSAEMALGDSSFSARVILKDISIRNKAQETLLQLPQVSSEVEWFSLAKRDPRLYSIRVDGVQVDFIRDAAGRIDFTSPLFQDATRNSASGSGSFNKVLSHPLFSKMSGFELNDALLTYYNLQSGKYWLADKGTVIINSQNGDLELRAAVTLPAKDGIDTKAEVVVNRQFANDYSDVRIGFENADPQDLASEFQALNWMRSLDTKVSGNLGLEISDGGFLTDLAGVLKVGEGRLIAPPSDDIVGFDEAKVYFTYNRDDDVLSFTELQLVTSYGYFTAEGSAALSRDAQGRVSEVLADLKFSDVLLAHPDYLQGPLQFSVGTAEVRAELAPFRVEVPKITVRDDTSVYTVDGSSVAGAEAWQHRYTLNVDRLPKDRLMALWPTVAIPKTRRWVDENILAGEIARLRGVFWNEEAKPHFVVDFSLNDVESRFMRTMPTIQNGYGGARLTDRFLQIDLSAGHVTAPDGGRLNLAGSSLFIEDITVRPAIGDIHLRTRSDLQAALSIIDRPPFEFLRKVKLAPDVATGRANVTAFLTLPLTRKSRPKDVDFYVQADLFDVESDQLFPGRTLTAPALQFAAGNDRVAITGTAQVAGQPTEIDWSMPIVFGQKPQSVLLADLTVDDAVLRDLGIALPDGFLQGETPVRARLDLNAGQPPRYQITSGLLGSAMAIPALGWRKGTKEPGKLFVEGRFGAQPTVDELRLDAAGLTAEGHVELTEAGAFRALVLPKLKLYDWMDVTARLSPPDRGGNTVAVQGGFIDASRMPSDRGGGRPSTLDIALDEFRITDGITLTDLRSQAVSNEGLKGVFSGNVNGGAPLNGHLIPGEGGTRISLTGEDAGRMLRDAGIFPFTRGGDMTLDLTPGAEDGAFDFAFYIEKTRLKDSGAMASLLNAISVVGLLQQLEDDGIHFEVIDGEGTIHDNGVQIRRLSATGASMGLTLQGWYDPAADSVDFEGVVTPIYILNGPFERILGKLFGRDKGEGLFGFTYTVKGDAEDPKVAVNPLSILAPGVFREIFRRDPPPPPAVQ